MRIDSKSIQESVHATLRKKILCLQLKPGTVVSTQEIATLLSVSRTPVREAFIRLQRDGLVDIYPQKETVISRINLNRIKQERFIRESLECANIDFLTSKGGPYDFSALYKNLEEQKHILEKIPYDGFEFFKIDNEFHSLLFALSGQHLSGQVVADMSTHYMRVRLVTLWNIDIAKISFREHEMILSEIKANLAELARGHIRYHMYRLDNEIDSFVKEYPDYFESEEIETMNDNGSLITM